MKLLLFAVLLCLLAGPQVSAVDAGASAASPHVAVELLVPPASLAPGQDFTAGLHFKLQPGWHVYWSNAGDSGEPPQVRWTLPPGITAGELQFPAPKRLPLGPLMDFGYEDEVVFPISMHVGAAPGLGAGGLATLVAQVNWLVCRETCIPGRAMLTVPRPVDARGTAGVDAGAAALVGRFVARLPQPVPADHATFAAGSAGGNKSWTVQLLTGRRERAAQFFPYDQDEVANAAPQHVIPLEGGVQIVLAQDANLQKVPAELHGLIVLGEPPMRAFEVRARPGVLAASGAKDQAGSGLQGLVRGAALAFVGGILLNLMPCVFPVLFLKGLSLLQSSQEERDRMRTHGWVYTLGIVVSFWAVVALLLGLRAAGHQMGWGFQFQSPIFIAVMALFLFFLALSLAGQFEIGLSLTSAGGRLADQGGYAGSFFTGVLAMVVATPCTAPFMGAAIGYALAASAGVSFAVFTALGLGLAGPYLLLAYHPAWTRLLPRPGAWMEVLKQAIAVPIFATVIWLVWLFTQSAGANALLGLLAGFLLLAVAGWMLGRWPGKLAATVAAGLVLALAVGISVAAANTFAVPVQAAAGAGGVGGNAWVAFAPDVVEKYRALGKPVLVDFTASWCLSCQVNERVVLDRADVQQRLRESGVVLVRADWTRHDETIGAALAALGRSGIPAYALYPAGGAEPQLLPEVLTPGIVYAALAG
ncbi:MAG TPA: protein-disulfide reductase DsbD domain-containing protein, partial [Acidobacteriaceae bacterium]